MIFHLSLSDKFHMRLLFCFFADIEEENTALAEAQAQLGVQFPSFVVQEDVQLQAMESDESL